MSILKKVMCVVLLFLMTNQLVYSQRRGGMAKAGRTGAQNNRRGSAPRAAIEKKVTRFSAKKASGLIRYDIVSVLEKIKIKDKNKQKQFIGILQNYNQHIEDITITHFDTLKAMEIELGYNHSNKRKGITTGISQKVKQKLLHIKQKVLDLDQKMQLELIPLLSKKSYRKWKKIRHTFS